MVDLLEDWSLGARILGSTFRERVILLKHKFRWRPLPAEHFLEVGVVLGVHFLKGEHVGGELFFTEIIFYVAQLHGGGSFPIVH